MAETYKITNLKIGYVQGSEREIAAEWKFGGANDKEPRKSLDHFSYAWLYNAKIGNDFHWIEGESGEKSWDRMSTTFTQSWTPPDNAVDIKFKIRAFSKTKEEETGSGKNKKTIETDIWTSPVQDASFNFNRKTVPTKKVDGITIDKQITQEGLAIRARWTWDAGSDGINSSNCDGWAYEFRKFQNGIWQDGESGERVYDGPSALYPSSGNLEAGVKKVKFNVTPIPKGSLFVGAKPKWEEINILPMPRQVGQKFLRYVEKTNNTFAFEWVMWESTKGITGFECQYQYYIGTKTGGNWLPVSPSSSTVDFASSTEKEMVIDEVGSTMTSQVWTFTFEPDSAASQIRARVKPVSTVDGTLFNDEWSDWIDMDIQPLPRDVSDISIRFVKHTKNTVQASWKLGSTEDVASFSYEWQYSTVSGLKTGNWLVGQSGSVNLSDYSGGTWKCIYSFPDEAKKAQFRVKVVPTYERAFKSDFSTWVKWEPNIPEVELENKTIEVLDPTTGILRARWKEYKTFEVDAYEYTWKYNLSTTASNRWIEGGSGTTKNTYVDVTPPDDVSNLKVFVKANAKYASEFTGTYGKAVFWDHKSLKTRNLDNFDIRFQIGADRKVDASWRIEGNTTDPAGAIANVTGFDYIWRYSIANDPRAWRYPGGNGTVDVNDGVAYSTKSGYTNVFVRWAASFDFPENASKIFFSVKPNPSSQLAFASDYSAEQEFKWKQTLKAMTSVTIKPTTDLTDYKVDAVWDPIEIATGEDAEVDHYECEWSYLYQGRFWYESPVEADPRTCAYTYTFPEQATAVRVTVTAVPKYEHQFYCTPSNAKTFSINSKTVKIGASKIKLNRLSDDTRTLVVNWSIPTLGSLPGWDYTPDSYDVEWDYTQNGVHFTETRSVAGDATYLQDTFDSPEQAEKVWVRIRPVFENNPVRTGEWSDREKIRYDWELDTVEIDNVNLALQRGTDRTIVATWTAPVHPGLESYEYVWRYIVDGVRFSGGSGTTTADTPACTYDAPDVCEAVDFKVKAVPSASSYFVSDYTAETSISVPANNTPEAPSAPTVTITGFNLRATLDTYDEKTVSVEFEVVDETKTLDIGVGLAEVSFNRASIQTAVSVGHAYRVRARGMNLAGEYGEWSNYSSDVYTIPAAITTPISVEATSSTSVRLTWKVPMGIYAGTDTTVNTATIERTTKKNYFDTAPDQVQSTTINYLREAETAIAEITQLDKSDDGYWYFRIKSTNSAGDSEWSKPVSAVLGTIPDAPTTWSSTMTATTDRDIYLFWVHNSEDESKERSAQIYLDVNGTVSTVTVTKESGDDTTSSYMIAAGTYPIGATIRWKVKTKGVVDDYGDWSVTRQVEIYAPPSLSLSYTSGISGNEMISFPLGFTASASPQTQTPIAYSITITSNSSYDGRDDSGVLKPVVAGEVILSKYVISGNHEQDFTILPSDVNLVSLMNYTLSVTVSMDSGLSATVSRSFTTRWQDQEYVINAGIGYSEDTIAAYISPYCTDENDTLISDVELAVYRKEFDGSLTLIMDGIENNRNTTVIDPHPALDFARYRIVAKSTINGNVEFVDLVPYPIGETAIVLQWNEEWTSFNNDYEGSLVDEPHNGSFLKLPYNVKISDSNTIDSQMIEYIGRKHPVSYYGTQVGQKLTLNTDIPLTDTETILALRRLAVWMGDVYVREPSGSGYWSKVEVSFSQTRTEVTIPVTINVTRVEGGV